MILPTTIEILVAGFLCLVVVGYIYHGIVEPGSTPKDILAKPFKFVIAPCFIVAGMSLLTYLNLAAPPDGQPKYDTPAGGVSMILLVLGVVLMFIVGLAAIGAAILAVFVEPSASLVAEESAGGTPPRADVDT